MADFLVGAYRIIAKNRWWALLTLSLLVSVLFFTARQIEFDDDITSLIPATEDSERIQKILESIAFTDKIVVNIRKDSIGSVDDLIAYANEFLDSIETSQGEFIKKIQGRVDPGDVPRTLDLVYENLPIFLDASDYNIIQNKLSKDSIDQITLANYRTLLSPTGIVSKKNILKDPLGLSFIALKKLEPLSFGDGFKIKQGFLMNDKEENILLFITPKFGSNETNRNLPFADALYEIQDNLDAKYVSRVKGEYFGAALSAVSNANQIKHDIQFTVGIALTLLLFVLILFYRKLLLPIILFAPTLFGGVLAVAFLCLIRTKVSALSLGIGSILLGVTLDYGLHILTHIRNGKSIESLYQEVAPSVFISSLTTASAFLCLLFIDSQALQDLGIFAAISVLGASVFALILIPHAYKKTSVSNKHTLLDRLASYDLHKNKWAISALAVLFVISLITYNRVVFDQDIAKLNYETQTLLDARERLEKLTDIGSKSIYVSTYGDDLEQVLQQNDSLFQKLERLKKNDKIVSYSSIGALIKSRHLQEQKIDAWKQFWNPEKINTLKQNLNDSATELGFKKNAFSEFQDHLENKFRILRIDDLKPIKSFSIDDYLVQDPNGVTITSLIKVDDTKTDLIYRQFEESANTLLVDRQHVNETFLGNLKNDFNRLLGYSLVVVLLILFVYYRSLTLTLITAVPIFMTWFITVGIMGLLHIEFNIFNIIICSFIFGLGVDYSIFITNGLLIRYRTGEKTLPTHKTSILLSVITTIAGVGVLVFAKHPVLFTISTVSLVGILCAVLVAFIIQPLLFRLFLGDTDKRPIQPRILLHSLLSFGYFDLGGILFGIYSWFHLKIDPGARLKPQSGLHYVVSKFMKSVLYTNPFLSKHVINHDNETFDKPAMLIANHTSFLDILVMGMLHPKSIYLVKDHVYNSKTVGYAARLHGSYPVSGGVENGEAYLKQKIAQGFSLIAFPEGTRSTNNKIKRFHKGAFYLAEQLQLDIVPIMIHGCSEVSPKDSFIIRDGAITAELMERIPYDDTRFGASYSQRAKHIGAYFRAEFRKRRNNLEGPTYWHKLILENYRYKGEAIYRSVKSDLKNNQDTYKKILGYVNEKTTIVHLSEDFGQLDLLLALDSIDRKITSFIADLEARAILKNNYLTHRYSKITTVDSIDEALGRPASVLILNLKSLSIASIADLIMDEISILILLKGSLGESPPPNFTTVHQNDNFIVLKRGLQQNEGVL